MKKLFALSLALVMALSLFSACSDSNDPAEATTPTEATTGATTTGGATEATTEGSGGARTGPNGEELAEEQTLVLSYLSDPQNFMPNTTDTDGSYAYIQNMYHRLGKMDASKQYIPDLAHSWDTSADGLTITFYLEEHAKWSDGEALDAHDVKYTFDVIKENETYFGYDFMIKVDHIDVIDDHTVAFVLKSPDVSIVGSLSWLACFILPEHIYNNGQTWDDNPESQFPTVVSGGYKLDSFTPGVSVILVKNENAWQTEPYIEKIIYMYMGDAATRTQSLLNGEIDMAEAPAAEVENISAAGFKMLPDEYPSPMYLLFNYRHEEIPYAVRLALAHCIDRDDIVNKLFPGIRRPEVTFYPAVMGWAANHDAPAPEFNLEEAARILEESGLEKDSNGYYYTIDCYHYTSSQTPDMAKLIQGNCEKVGINFILEPLEYQAWSDVVSLQGEGDFDTALMGGFQGPDVTALQNRIGTGELNNLGAYSNTRIDELFLEGKTNTDQSFRKPIYDEIQKILSEELPIIPIINYASITAVNPKLMGVPLENAGKGGWAEWSYAYFVK